MTDGTSKTVGERIMEYLGSLPIARLTEAQTWPRAATQDGIAEELGLERAHVAIELNRLRRRDRVERLQAHVEGGRQSRYVYRPGRHRVGAILLKDIVECPDCGKEIRVSIVEG